MNRRRCTCCDCRETSAKDEAIRQGFLHARDRGWLSGADWIGYWDADLATPLSEIDDFLTYAALSGTPPDGILGSRVSKLGSTIVRSYVRHILGRLFTTAAAALLHLRCYDSQCGAKLFRPDDCGRSVRRAVRVALDFRRGDSGAASRPPAHRISRCGRWVDVRGSKLGVLKVAVPTLVDLVRIRRATVYLEILRRARLDAERRPDAIDRRLRTPAAVRQLVDNRRRELFRRLAFARRAPRLETSRAPRRHLPYRWSPRGSARKRFEHHRPPRFDVRGQDEHISRRVVPTQRRVVLPSEKSHVLLESQFPNALLERRPRCSRRLPARAARTGSRARRQATRPTASRGLQPGEAA